MYSLKQIQRKCYHGVIQKRYLLLLNTWTYFFPEDRHFSISIQQPDDNTNYYNLINGATGEEIELYIVSEQKAREEDYDYLFNYGLIKKGILPNYVLGEINSCFKKLNDEFYYEILKDK